MDARQDILEKLTAEGYMAYPKAVDNIIEYENTDKLVKRIIEEEDSDTVDEDTVSSYVNEIENKDKIDVKKAFKQYKNQDSASKSVDDIVNRKQTIDERYPDIANKMFKRELPNSENRTYESDFEIKKDISGNSRTKGEFDDFVSLFKNRYKKLLEILKTRVPSLHEVGDIKTRVHEGKEIVVGGLVSSKFISSNQNYFIDIEDPSTNELMRFGWTDDDIKSIFEEVVEDEVIAIRGNLSGDIIWGDTEVNKGRPPIMFPDVPRTTSSPTDKEIKCAMISDIHVGSEEFRPDKWNKFVDWVRRNEKVQYVFVAGDIVEGIGVYPNQREELEVTDIKDQYAIAAKMFDQLPDDITIIASVGNHDTVRLAEPQPKLSEKFSKFFSENVFLTGNPVTVNLHGRDIIMYHGMSIYDIAESIPGLSAENPIPVMKKLLKKRHLSPIYGQSVRLSPESKDLLVIDEVPDLLHSGHVHKYGQDNYQGVRIVNTATWQDQTDFQKSKGISPDCGFWSVVNLSNMNVEKRNV